jgi:hypothetical protein
MTASEFMNFVKDVILVNDLFKDYIGDGINEYLGYFDKFSNRENLTKQLSASEMATFFGIDKENIEKLYLFYKIIKNVIKK